MVSGLAAGVDSAWHRGALDAGGDTIGVVASSVDQGGRYWQPEPRDDVNIVSQFQPNIPWSRSGTLQRKATSAALSDNVVIISAGESGGSWEMGQLCFKKKSRSSFWTCLARRVRVIRS